jgi:AcrR family transcriptional regulator
MLSSATVILEQTASAPNPEADGSRSPSEKIHSAKIHQVPRKKTAQRRPRTGNQRDPLLHQAIIAAAAEVLIKQGPTRFTIEAVAKLAGCGKPTIYRWWPSRYPLLLEVYHEAAKQELAEPEGKNLAKDLAVMLRQVWRFWRDDCHGSLYRLILFEMMLEKDGARYLREDFIPRRQAVAGIVFQKAKDRGEIPPETDIKFLMDVLFGYSLYRLITGQLDDDEVADRISAIIAKLARNGLREPESTAKRRNGETANGRAGDTPNC